MCSWNGLLQGAALLIVVVIAAPRRGSVGLHIIPLSWCTAGGSSFAGGCDATIAGNWHDTSDSKCTFVAFPMTELGTIGFNFTRTNGTQPYTCGLQYEVSRRHGAGA